jgi:hypothetical protein
MFNEHSASGGVVSNRYGIGWFSGDLSEDYLCQKFLGKEWVPDRAKDSLKDMLEDEDSGLGEEQKESIRRAIYGDTFDDPTLFGIWWQDTFDDYPESIGYGYNPGSAGWLSAVQQRFSVLYSLFTKGVEGSSTFKTKELLSDEVLREKLKQCLFYPSTNMQDYPDETYLLEDALKAYPISEDRPDIDLVMKRAML